MNVLNCRSEIYYQFKFLKTCRIQGSYYFISNNIKNNKFIFQQVSDGNRIRIRIRINANK